MSRIQDGLRNIKKLQGATKKSKSSKGNKRVGPVAKLNNELPESIIEIPKARRAKLDPEYLTNSRLIHGDTALLATWVRATLPRLRLDQILSFAWKYLFPLSLINVVLLATEVLVWPEPDTGDLLVMGAINWVVAIASVAAMSRIVSLRTKGPVRAALVGSETPGTPVRSV